MPLNEYVNIKNQLSNLFLLPNPQPFPAVHGVGVGRDNANNYKVRLYVTEHNERIFALIANALGLPAVPSNFPIRLGETGLIEIVEIICNRADFAVNTGSEVIIREKCKKNAALGSDELKKLIAGISVGLTENYLGTIAYFCEIGGSKYLLSNSHVIAKWGNAPTDTTKVKREVKTNAGLDFAEIARLKFTTKIEFVGTKTTFPKNKLDAALAKLSVSNISPLIYGGTSFQVKSSFPIDNNDRAHFPINQTVTKHGLGSCWSGGMVDDVDCDFIVAEGVDKALFVNQFRIVGDGEQTDQNGHYTFATNGDSGSLVFEDPPLTDNSNPKKVRAVALVFAKGNKQEFFKKSPKVAPNTEYTLATPMYVVKKHFNMKLIGEP